jgi:hypothetical protein
LDRVADGDAGLIACRLAVAIGLLDPHPFDRFPRVPQVKPAVRRTELALKFRDALAPVRLRHAGETRPTGTLGPPIR